MEQHLALSEVMAKRIKLRTQYTQERMEQN